MGTIEWGICANWKENRDGNIEKSAMRFLGDGLNVGQKTTEKCE